MLALRLFVLALVPLVGSCVGAGFPGSGLPAGLGGTPPAPPEVSVQDVRLVRAPAAAAVARWMCERFAPAFVCRAFGPMPSDAELRFVFDVEIELVNRNAIPVPLVSTLFAFTVFPDIEIEGQPLEGNLGTACVALCDTHPCDTERACVLDGSEIRDQEDFGRAAMGFLLDVAREERRFEDLRIRTLPAGDRARVVFQLEVSSRAMLPVLERVLGDAIASVREGRRPDLSIPYRLEGTAFLDVEGFGRFAASIPPVDRTWVLGQRLLPADR